VVHPDDGVRFGLRVLLQKPEAGHAEQKEAGMKPAAALIGPMMQSISQGTGNDHMDALHRYRAEKD
jgi:hypothetical protein